MDRRRFLTGASALALSAPIRKAEAGLRLHGTPVSTTWQPGQRPFAASSPVNQPLPANSIFTPCMWDSNTGGNYFAIVKWAFDLPSPSAPVCATVASGGQAFVSTTSVTKVRQLTSGLTFTEPSDKQVVSIVGNDCMSFELFTRTDDANAACFQYGECTDILHDSGFGAKGIYAAGCAPLVGALIKEEFTAGEILHMIGLCVEFPICNSAPPFGYPPSIGNDGSSQNGFIMEGQIMAIPPGTAMPSGFSVFGQKIFRAARDFGVFVFDVGGATQFYMGVNFNNAATTWTSPDFTAIANDTPVLCTLLQKTGYPIDGLITVIAPYETCAPQVQQLLIPVGNLMHVTRDSDSTGIDIGKTAAPQSLLDTTSLATFCSGTTGRVSTYFGQFSNNNFASAGANAPIIFQSGALKTINGQPALAFDGSTNFLKATGSSGHFPFPTGPNNNLFLNAVVQISDYLANYGIFGSNSANGIELRVDQTTGVLRLLKNGGATIALSPVKVPLNAPFIASAHYNGDGSFAISVNGTVTVSGTAALVAVTAGDAQVGAGGPAGTELFKGLIGSWLICSQSPVQPKPQYSIEQYQRNFWGTLGAGAWITDNFTDTNGTDLASHTMNVGPGWTDLVGTHFIQSNSATPNTLAGGIAISGFTAGSNGTLTAVLTGFGTAGNVYKPALVFRYVDANNYWWLELDVSTNQVTLHIMNTGFPALVATLSMALVSGTGFTVAVTYQGPNISFTVNGANLTSSVVPFYGFFQSATISGIKSISVGTPPSKCTFNTLTFTV